MIQVRVDRNWNTRDGYSLWVFEHRDKASFVAKPMQIEFVELDNSISLPTPTLSVSGALGAELINSAKQSFAGMEWASKDDYSHFAKVEKAMQGHIESLKQIIGQGGLLK